MNTYIKLTIPVIVYARRQKKMFFVTLSKYVCFTFSGVTADEYRKKCSYISFKIINLSGTCCFIFHIFHYFTISLRKTHCRLISTKIRAH